MRFPLMCLLLSVITGYFSASHALIYQRKSDDITIPYENIYEIIETKNGYIWLATDIGLIRFDGLNSQLYQLKSQNNAAISKVYTVHVDTRGNIWLGTAQGVSMFNPQTEKFEHFPVFTNNHQQKISIWEIKSLDKRHLLLNSIFDGFYLFNLETRKITQSHLFNSMVFTKKKGATKRINRNVVVLKDKLLFSLINNGLYEADKKLMQAKKIPLDFDLTLYHTLSISRGYLWIATRTHLYQLNKQSYKTIKKYAFPLSKNYNNRHYIVRSMYVDEGRNTVIIATLKNGVLVLKNGIIEQDIHDLNNQSSLSSDFKENLFADSYGNIWIAGYAHSLDKIDLSQQYLAEILPITKNPKGQLNLHSPINLFKEDNKLWIGTNSGIIVNNQFVSSNTSEHFINPNPNTRGTVLNIKKLANKYYALTDNGLWFLDKNGHYIKQIALDKLLRLLKNQHYYDMVVDELNQVWIATSNGVFFINSLDAMHHNKFDFNQVIHSENNWFLGFVIANKEIIAANNQSELFIIDLIEKKITQKVSLQEYASETSQIMLLNQKVWIASNNGLLSYDLNTYKIHHYIVPKAIASNDIKVMNHFDNEEIYLGTSYGLSKFSLVSQQFSRVYKDNLLNKVSFNPNSTFADSDNLYMGSSKQVVIINKQQEIKSIEIPKVAIHAVDVLSNPMKSLAIYQKNTKALALAYRDNSFKISFSAVNYPNQKALSYQYRMQGFTNQWFNHQSSTDGLEFAHVPSGDYMFEVRATLDGISWGKITQLKLRINTPWWRNYWAYLAYFLIALTVLCIYIYHKRKYVKTLIEKNQQLKFTEQLFNGTSDAICIVCPDFKVIEVNEAFCQLMKVNKKFAFNQDFNFAITADQTHNFKSNLMRQVFRNGKYKGDVYIKNFSKKSLAVALTIDELKQPTHCYEREFLLTFSDITERKNYETELTKLSYYDNLTKLPNRTLFIKEVRKRILAYENNGKKFAVAYMDLNDFKKVNDFYGHMVGDELLKVIGNKLKKLLDSSITISRFGGDEFCLLIPQIKKQNIDDYALKIVTRINNYFLQQVTLSKHNVLISFSIGVSIYPDHALYPEQLLQYADIAMYASKNSGGSSSPMYENSMQNELMSRVAVEVDLKNALKNSLIEPFLQPIVNAATAEVTSYEMLARWITKDGKVIPPNVFISVAEKSNLIDDLIMQLLEKLTQSFHRIKNNLRQLNYISINLSPKQIYNERFIESIKTVVQNANINTSLILIEITETAIISSPKKALTALLNLKKMGFCIALDDFGTGQSSLTHLKDFPVDVIKIDQSFIMTMRKFPTVLSIVESVIRLAKKLDMKVIAEGVENEAEYKILKDLDCDCIQGYYFGKPEPIINILTASPHKKIIPLFDRVPKS